MTRDTWCGRHVLVQGGVPLGAEPMLLSRGA